MLSYQAKCNKVNTANNNHIQFSCNERYKNIQLHLFALTLNILHRNVKNLGAKYLHLKQAIR